MSANKNNHNRSACKFLCQKTTRARCKLAFLRHENHVFVIDLPPQSVPKNSVTNLSLKSIQQSFCVWSQTLSEIEFEILCLPTKKLGDLKKQLFVLLSLLKFRNYEKDTQILKFSQLYLT